LSPSSPLDPNVFQRINPQSRSIPVSLSAVQISFVQSERGILSLRLRRFQRSPDWRRFVRAFPFDARPSLKFGEVMQTLFPPAGILRVVPPRRDLKRDLTISQLFPWGLEAYSPPPKKMPFFLGLGIPWRESQLGLTLWLFPLLGNFSPLPWRPVFFASLAFQHWKRARGFPLPQSSAGLGIIFYPPPRFFFPATISWPSA